MGRVFACLLAGGLVAFSMAAPGMAEESVQAPEDERPVLMLPIEQDELAAVESAEPLRLSMEFQDANLSDVLKIFSEQTGINVIASSGIGETPITLYLREVRVLDALDQILTAANLTYERAQDSDIYIVKAKSGDQGRTITRVYRLKYARVSESVLATAATAFAAQTPFEASLESTSSGSSGSGGTSASSSGSSSETTGKGIDTVLKNLLTGEGKLVVDSRTNSLIMTDVPENFPRIEAALATLDVRTRQILVDAEIVETSFDKLKDLGVEWGTGAEGDLLNFNGGSGRSTRFPLGSLGRMAPSGSTAFGTNTISMAAFDGVLQALQLDTNTKILARPKVLTLDNESAIIRLTSDETIGFTTGSQATTETVTSQPERTTTGVVLVVTPQVNDDGYITMIVEPAVTKTVASKITAPQGSANTRDPKTRSSRSLVRIRSGDTLVVGGLIDRSEQEMVRRVPILSGIPVLGEAFKNTEVNNNASELIVFVTPRVLDENPTTMVASSNPSSFGRAQEAVDGKQDLIEQTLNRLETSSR